MESMFSDYCASSRTALLNLSSFDTNKVTEFSQMLQGIRLESFRISPNFTLNLVSCSLTNSSGSTAAT